MEKWLDAAALEHVQERVDQRTRPRRPESKVAIPISIVSDYLSIDQLLI